MLALIAAAALAGAEDYQSFDADRLPEVQAALALLDKGELVQCMESLKKVGERQPLLPPPPLLVGMRLLNTGKLSEGRRILEQAAAMLPRHPDVALTLGFVALKEGRFADAALQYREAIDLSAAERWTADQKRQFLATAHSGSALVAEMQGDWKRARAALRHLHQNVSPGNAAILNKLGRATFLDGERGPGEDMVRAAARQDPNLPPAETTLGNLWMAVGGKEAEADRLLAEGATEFPKSSAAQLAWIQRLLAKGDGKESVAASQAALKALPDNVDVRLALLLALRQAGEFVAAARQGQQWLEATPQNSKLPTDGRPLWPIYANQTALALAECAPETDRKKALELAENAKQGLRPAEALATLGRCKFRLGQTEDAEKHFAQALATSEASSDVPYYVALAANAKGDRVRAVRELDRALAAPGPFVNRARAAALRQELKPPAPNPPAPPKN